MSQPPLPFNFLKNIQDKVLCARASPSMRGKLLWHFCTYTQTRTHRLWRAFTLNLCSGLMIFFCHRAFESSRVCKIKINAFDEHRPGLQGILKCREAQKSNLSKMNNFCSMLKVNKHIVGGEERGVRHPEKALNKFLRFTTLNTGRGQKLVFHSLHTTSKRESEIEKSHGIWKSFLLGKLKKKRKKWDRKIGFFVSEYLRSQVIIESYG